MLVSVEEPPLLLVIAFVRVAVDLTLVGLGVVGIGSFLLLLFDIWAFGKFGFVSFLFGFFFGFWGVGSGGSAIMQDVLDLGI